MKIEISFGKFNLAIDSEYVRRRVRVWGIWTPFITCEAKKEGVRINIKPPSDIPPPVFTRHDR